MTFEEALRYSTQLVSSALTRGDNNQGQYAAKNLRDCLAKMLNQEGIKARPLTSPEKDATALTLCTAVLQGTKQQGDFCAQGFHDAKVELALIK